MTNTAPSTGTFDAPALQEVLVWLGAEQETDPLRHLPALRTHVVAVTAMDIPAVQHLKLLDLFRMRTEALTGEIKPLLLDATLPIPRQLRTVALALMEVHGTLASGYLKVIRRAAPEKLRALNFTPAHLCAQGLAHLVQEYEIAQLISLPASADFWRCAQALYGLIRTGLPTDDQTVPEVAEAERSMKVILALATAQPEGFSPRETSFLADYLRQQATALEIGREDRLPAEDEYWLDEARGLPPVAASRLMPSGDRPPIHFSCKPLGTLAHRHLTELGSGDRPESLGIPGAAVLADYRSVLNRAEVRWSNPPKRRISRRHKGYRVQVCTHLGQLWQQLHGSGPDGGEPLASEWLIRNESANGYAIMHVAGELGGIVSGSAIGLRSAPDVPWNICIVRWARSELADHIELGLELVAPTAEAVRVARSGPDAQQPIPALRLPALPSLNRAESLLTARGNFRPGPFTLLVDSAERLQVSDCLAGQLTLHTACIEIFEFDRNPAP